MFGLNVWQDWLFAIGQLGFFFAVIPAIRGENKPPLSMIIMTVVILVAFIPANATLGLYLAASMDVSTVGAWSMLAFQQITRTYGFAFLTPEAQRGRDLIVFSGGYYRIWRLVAWQHKIDDSVPIEGNH